MRRLLLVALLLGAAQAGASAVTVDAVRVVKSERRLYLLSAGAIVREFPVALGSKPLGHKQQEGDGRTPEGRYVLDYRKADSGYYRAIRISYPNPADRKRASRLGVSPGGNVMIHGQKNGYGRWSFLTQRFDWTLGCIALADADMQQVWELVAIGTPIEIRP